MVKDLDVVLRKWPLEDVKDLATAINNKKVLNNLRGGIPFPYTRKDAEEYINAMLAAKQDTQHVFAITYNKKVIGSIGVFRKEDACRITILYC